MNKMVIFGLLALGLSACAGEVSTSLVKPEGVLMTDLKAASFNLQKAVEVGVLPADDPAPACLAGLLEDLGLGKDAQSFVPMREGIVSEGALLYIRAQQVKALQGFQLPSQCDAIVGRFVIDSAKAGGKLIPGAGLLLR